MPRKRVNTTRRTNWLLVVGGCLAVTAMAVGYWQYSSDATPGSPAPMQLKIAAAPAASNDVAPAVPSKEVVAPTTKALATKALATKAPTTKAPTTKEPTTKEPISETAPRVVVRRDPPAATTVERRENAVPPAAVTTFMIIHDHSRGNFESDDPEATCVGKLVILENELRFEPREGGDRFAASWADVKDVGGNRFFGSGKGGFHVAVKIGGKYKNFNLAPESNEKAEAKLILDLLNSYTRKTDRTK